MSSFLPFTMSTRRAEHEKNLQADVDMCNLSEQTDFLHLLCLQFCRENYCTCCAEAFLVAANAGRSSTTQLCGEWGWWLVRITSEAESLQIQSDIKVEVVYTVVKGSLEETISAREIQNHHNRSITADYTEKSSGWRWYLAVVDK